jgi:hypothetical protein
VRTPGRTAGIQEVPGMDCPQHQPIPRNHPRNRAGTGTDGRRWKSRPDQNNRTPSTCNAHLEHHQTGGRGFNLSGFNPLTLCRSDRMGGFTSRFAFSQKFQGFAPGESHPSFLVNEFSFCSSFVLYQLLSFLHFLDCQFTGLTSLYFRGFS